MAATSARTREDKLWREQDDARILASADEIMKDKTRLAGAKKQAKVMAKDQEKQLKSIRRVAGVKPKK